MIKKFFWSIWIIFITLLVSGAIFGLIQLGKTLSYVCWYEAQVIETVIKIVKPELLKSAKPKNKQKP